MSDQVKNPKHYQILDGVESIEIIARSMTVEQWHGFCLGNILKYRIRAGKKGDLAEDIAKADFYQELYERHKNKCHGALGTANDGVLGQDLEIQIDCGRAATKGYKYDNS